MISSALLVYYLYDTLEVRRTHQRLSTFVGLFGGHLYELNTLWHSPDLSFYYQSCSILTLGYVNTVFDYM